MKTRHKLLSALAIAILFLGRMSESTTTDGAVISLAARTAHAQELLGKTYDRSPASRHERNVHLEQEILSEVQVRLPERDSAWAEPITRSLVSESRRHGFDPVFLLAVIQTESKFRRHARGSHGEIGLMQIKPATAEWIAARYGIKWQGDLSLTNPQTNIRLGSAYLAYLRGEFERRPKSYLAAYNLGPGLARRLSKKLPQRYPLRVMGAYERFYKELGAPERDLVAKLTEGLPTRN